MSGKTILGLDLATYPALAEDQFIPIHQTGQDEAERTPLSWYVPVTWDSTIAYVAGRQIWFQKQLFLVLTATAAAESPITHRAKYQWIGGGVNIANTAAGLSSATSATLDTNSGVVSFTALAISAGTFEDLIINNSLLVADTDVSVYLANIGGAGTSLTITQKYITNGALNLTVFNPSGGSVDDLFVWFSNQA